MSRGTVVRQQDVTTAMRQNAIDTLLDILRDGGTKKSQRISAAVILLNPSKDMLQGLNSKGEFNRAYVSKLVRDLRRRGSLKGLNLGEYARQ